MSENKENNQDHLYFCLKLYKSKSIRIHKPLLFLKLALFLWFAGATTARTFFTVFLKQRGLSITEISFIYILTPIVQILCTSLLSIIADKVGRSKPILVGNILFAAATALALNLVSYAPTEFQTVAFSSQCSGNGSEHYFRGECGTIDNNTRLKSCDVVCPPDYTIIKHVQFNSSVFIDPLNTSSNDTCFYDVSSSDLIHDAFPSMCAETNGICQVSCTTGTSKNLSSWIYISISLLFFVTFVNVFRFFDIAAMALVKEYDSDYGFHRFFSICGNLVGPVLSGYIVDWSTPDGGDMFYDAAFYAYAAFCVLTALVVAWVEVGNLEPAKNMWKKSSVLLKDPDAMFVVGVVTVIGMTWGFAAIFKYLYLEGFAVDAYQFGLIEVVHSGVGLPILLMSSLLIRKIGTENIFVLALGSQAVFCFGYSFLRSVSPALVLELTAATSYHLLWVAVMEFCRDISPPGLVATVNALAGSLHYALGRVLGSVVGGSLMNNFGGRTAFLVLGITNVATAFIYSIFLIVRNVLKNKK